MSMEKSIHQIDRNIQICSIGDVPYCWFDPIKTSEMRISGFYRIEEERIYRRLPIKEKGYFTDGVDRLAYCCAGGQISFRTDSTCLAIDAEFSGAHTMYHMTPVGQLGFDCYIGECGSMSYAGTTSFEALA